MKKILALFILCMLCFCPILATADSCTDFNDNRSGCLNFGGCEWVPEENDEGFCTECESGWAHASCSGLGCDDECVNCASANWHYGPHKMYNSDPSVNTTGMSECPWKCMDGWFKSNDGDSCVQCPDNTLASTVGNRQIFGQYDHISDCDCATTERPDQYLIHSVETYSPYREVYYCGVCSVGARSVYNNSGNNPIYACDCNSAHAKSVFGGTAIPILGTTEANYANFWIECQCPEHSDITRSPNNDYNVCACNHNDGYIMSETAPWTCSRCQDTNAELYGTNDYCTCKEGYYGTLNGNSGVCTKCPIGTTIARGQSNTTKINCHATCNTKFYVNNNYYMRFIPSGIGTCTVTNAATGEVQSRLDQSQGIPR